MHVSAKRSLGQNFLVNPGVVARTVEAAQLGPGDTVLEVGPGTGTLTQALASTGARVIAIEKDVRLTAPLREQFTHAPNVEIIEADILKFDPTSYNLLPTSYKIVANIPYYVTSHLLRLMLERWPTPTRAVLMVQAEVAERMMAHVPDMNLLALSVQAYARPTLVMRVSRGSFRPIPDVDSAVIALEPLAGISREGTERMLALARRAFGQKRKQLKGSFSVSALEEAHIAPTARPQELSLDQWRSLVIALH